MAEDSIGKGQDGKADRQLHGVQNQHGLADATTITNFFMLSRMESCLKCYTLFHFKCFLYIQQDSHCLEKYDWENSSNKRSRNF